MRRAKDAVVSATLLWALCSSAPARGQTVADGGAPGVASPRDRTLGAPVASLAPQLAIEGEGRDTPHDFVAAGDQLLVARNGVFEVYAGEALAAASTAPAPRVVAVPELSSAAEVGAHGAMLHVVVEGRVTGLALPGLERRWRTAPLAPNERLHVVAASHSRLLLRSDRGNPGTSLYRLVNASTGAVLTSFSLPDATVVTVLDDAVITRTGRRFSAPGPQPGGWHVELDADPLALAAVGGRFFVARSDGAVQVGTLSLGAPAAPVPMGRPLDTLRALPAGVLGAGAGRVMLLSSTDGTPRWSAPAAPLGPTTIEGDAIVDGDSLYLCSAGVVWALDVATGAPRWSWGVGECGGFGLVRPAAPLAPLLVAQRGDTHALAVFARGGTVVPVQTATIAGSVDRTRAEGGARIEVAVNGNAPTTVRADARGRFRASVTGRGLVGFFADTFTSEQEGGGCAGTTRAAGFVELDGHTASYRVNLDSPAPSCD